MIVCPNCTHQNPDGATQCEACLTPLPATTSCPNCGAPVQTDASFCGQCGSNLLPSSPQSPAKIPATVTLPDMPDLVSPDPLVQPEPLGAEFDIPEPTTTSASIPSTNAAPELPPTVVSQPPSETEASVVPPPPPAPEVSVAPPPVRPAAGSAKTQLQQQTARLLHVQTNTAIELPQNLSVIHMGKPNDQIPPDIDVSGFPASEIVSRIHADIRVEGGAYYIEDVGSSNGTYINHNPLASGNRHRLRPGDRIGLGKGDMMTFLFQISS